VFHTLRSRLSRSPQVSTDIFAKVDQVMTDPEIGTVTSVEVTLMSNTLSASDIMKWVRKEYLLYKEQIRSSLGDTLYFFDNKSKESSGVDPRGTAGACLVASQPTQLIHNEGSH